MTIIIGDKSYETPYADLLPPLSGDERARLRHDISERGVMVAVVIDENSNVIDGANRLGIAAELGLGLAEVPFQVVPELSDEEKRTLAEDLNLHRRHLTREQIHKVIGRELKKDPGVSDRQVAAAVGVDHKTVGAKRAELEATGEIPQLSARKGKDDRVRAAKNKPKNTAGPSHGKKKPSNKLPETGKRASPWRGSLTNYAYCLSEAGRLAGELARTKVANRNGGRAQQLVARLRRIADDIEQFVAKELENVRRENNGTPALQDAQGGAAVLSVADAG